jgi:CRISPR-associated ramp protein
MIDVLEDDYLGGHGTRGYGRIKFKNFSLNIKTYTEENEKELASIKNELKNFEEKLGSKVK